MATYIVPYFGGLKDSPTCLHSLHEVTCQSERSQIHYNDRDQLKSHEKTYQNRF